MNHRRRFPLLPARTIAVACAFGWIAAGSAARGGGVLTRDGTKYDGRVGFDGADALTVSGHDGTSRRVPLADVRRATFTEGLDPEPSGPAEKPEKEKPASASSTQPASGAAGADGSAEAPQSLPAPWKEADVGRLIAAGSARAPEGADGPITIKASGWGTDNPPDSFHFVYQPFHGDGQIVARLDKFDDASAAVFAGLSFRQDLDPSAKHASLVAASPQGELRLKFRPGGGTPFSGGDVVRRPWLRLARRGDVFTAYASSDGRFWTQIEQRFVAMPPDVRAGLAVSTTTNVALGGATFDHLAVVPGTPGRTYFPGSDFPAEGLVLRDGTIAAGRVVSADLSAVRFIPGAPPPLPAVAAPGTPPPPPAPSPAVAPPAQPADDGSRAVPMKDVAAMLFNVAPPELAKQLEDPAAKGALLVSGDQVDGDFESFAGGSVTVQSIVLGPKKFDARTEAIAVLINPATRNDALWLVRTRDGSRYYAAAVAHEKAGVVVDQAALGKVVVADEDVKEIESPGKGWR